MEEINFLDADWIGQHLLVPKEYDDETLSLKCDAIAQKIIKEFNEDKVIKLKGEFLETEKQKYFVQVMVKKIIFTIDKCSFAHVTKGNDFRDLSKQLQEISAQLQRPNNAYYLQDNAEVFILIKALGSLLQERIKESKGRISNPLAQDIALRIYYAWCRIGYHDALDYTDGKSPQPKTKLAVFADITEKYIRSYLATLDKDGWERLGVSSLNGIRNPLKDIKSRNITAIFSPFIIQ